MKRAILQSLLCATGMLISSNAAAQTVLSHDFSSVAQFEAYTVVDQNQDGQTWQYDDIFLAAACARDYDSDDWLITPALTLDAQKTYRLVFEASVENEGSERVEVMLGQQPTAGALSRQLMGKTAVSSTVGQQYTTVFTVSSSGTYHIGLHSSTTGDPFSNRLYVQSLSVEETVNQNVPAAVSDLSATAAADGQLAATVSCRAPLLNVGGGPLTQLTAVRLYRDGQLVHTFSSPAAGEQLSYDDTALSNGSHTYRATAVNDYGESEAAETTVYVGTDVPGPVEDLRFTYDNATQQARLTWSMPTTGAHGGTVSTEGITYEVRRFHNDTPVITGLTATEFTEQMGTDFLVQCEEEIRQRYEHLGIPIDVHYVVDGQGLMQYYVRAVTAQGKGTEATSNSVIIGQQYSLPFADSFAAGQLTHYWRTDLRTSMARWSAMTDSRFSQDGDNGMLCFNAIEGNESAMVHTGNISMKDAQTPILTFYYYYDYAMAKPLTVKVSTDGGDFRTLTTIDLSDEGQRGRYLRASIPLTGCAGHDYVQVGFEASTTTTVDLIYIDNVRIIDQRQYDLTVEIAQLPRNLKVGQTRYLTANVENLGTADVATGQYTVDVFAGSTKVGTSMGMAVGAGQQQSMMIALQPTIDVVGAEGSASPYSLVSPIRADVVFAADEAPANNSSAEQTIQVKMPRHPAANALQAAADATSGVTLTWQQPAAPRTEDGVVTDSFEDYDDFQRTNFGDWTLYDQDRLLTWGLGEPWHFPHNSDIHSYIIWTPAKVENRETGRMGVTNAQWNAHTGEKCLASFGVSLDRSDDWLVSPELSGNQQLMSFYAHQGSLRYGPEQFQLYISTTGLEITNFMALDATPRTTTAEWQKFEYLLPQGTKYFALRKVTPTESSLAMLVDDITFAPDTLASQANLMFFGYNVYRNGQRINTALVPTPTFHDPEGQPGDSYRVTAIYNEGESIYSNTAVATGADAIGLSTTAAARTDHAIYNLQGQRVVAPHSRGIYIKEGGVKEFGGS